VRRTHVAADPLVYSSAWFLARRVWVDGPQSKVALIPVGAVAWAVDAPLALAQQRKWLRVDGDMVTKGSTNPVKMTPIGDVGSPRWGPGLLSPLFRVSTPNPRGYIEP
jgi:hypothetical protein